MTGLHTGHAFVRGNKNVDGHDLPLPADTVTVAEVLKEAGYWTGLVGKWGLGYNNTSGAYTHRLPTWHHSSPCIVWLTTVLLQVLHGCKALTTTTGSWTRFGERQATLWSQYALVDTPSACLCLCTVVGVPQANCHNMYPPFVWANETQIHFPTNFDASRERCMMVNNTCVWSHALFTNNTLEVLKERAADKSKPWYLFVSYTDPHAGGWSWDAKVCLHRVAVLFLVFTKCHPTHARLGCCHTLAGARRPGAKRWRVR